jgi:inner membrane protein
MEKFSRRNSITIRLLIIGLLILILLIPSVMIGALISERESRKREAITEITSKWAGVQTIGGPVLTIPYEIPAKDENGKLQTTVDYLQVLPELLKVDGDIQPQIRYRGIYKAILYQAKLNLQGSFSLEELAGLDLKPQQIKWNEAFIAVSIPDMRGIKDSIDFSWDNQPLALEPGIKNGNDMFNAGVSVRIPLQPMGQVKRSYPFALRLYLNGSEEFSVLPLGKTTRVHLTSAWNAPSFSGNFLPERRKIDAKGFDAEWKVLNFNRNYPQVWLGASRQNNIMGSKFGVNLFSPVDEYTKTTRAVKYLIMFVSLTFLIFFLVEVFNKRRIHPIQYLLIGLALCIFYVLLLSLTEHLNFELAYIIASFSIIAVITFYVKSAMAGKALMPITASTLVTLYGFLYVLLQNQDYALLLGSLGLFAILAIVMFMSRKVDWYMIELDSASGANGEQPEQKNTAGQI